MLTSYNFFMNKKKLIQIIFEELQKKFELTKQVAQNSRDEATHEDSKAENKYDTRGLEASYLAGAQAKRAAQIEMAVNHFENLLKTASSQISSITSNSLVRLQSNENSGWYFLSPYEGGLKVQCEKEEVLVLGTQSPLGAALIGKHEGDIVEVKTPIGLRDYVIGEIL